MWAIPGPFCLLISVFSFKSTVNKCLTKLPMPTTGIDPITKWFSIILRYAEFEPSEWLLKNVQPIGALQTNLA